MRHPLFPTIVAFWFAALFGLGSLAVRTSLLESLVIASKIDLIVPQTAPPLGMTARILIALGMAAIGSILGFLLAARMARPKPEAKGERVRSFGAAVRTAAPSRATPAQAWEEDDRSLEPERRRSLIASNEEPAEIFDDGPSFLTGLSPQVLDVTAFECEPIDLASAEPAQPQQSAPALELDAFATVDPVPAPGFESVNEPQVAAEPVPVAEVQPTGLEADHGEQPPLGLAAEDASPRVFDAPEARRPAFALPEAQPVSPSDFAEPRHEVPAAETRNENSAEPVRQTFGAPGTSPLHVTIAMPPVAASEQPQPLDTASPAETASTQEIPAVAAETDDFDPMAAFRNRQAPLPEFREEPAVLCAPEPPVTGLHTEPELGDAEPAATFALPEPEGVTLAAAPLSPAAERLMRAELSDLSQLELIERLALSLQRRGQVATAAPFLAAYQPEPEPEAHTPFEQESAAPAAEMRVEGAASVESDAPRLSLPAAMRPIDFSQYEQDEDMPEYVPARSIAMPSFKSQDSAVPAEPQFVAEAAEPTAAAAMPGFGRPAELVEPAARSEEEVLEAGYSSLLDMTRPAAQRQQFVRVIDPEAETEAAEPVVIFPGQAMRAGSRFAPPAQGPVVAPNTPLPSLGDAAGQVRRFDAPPPPAQFAPASAPVRNPEETERALRSALSTLQRMSGAA